MSKAEKCLELLEIYNSGQMFQKSDLARLLETNVRNISEYNKELLLAGYNVRSKTGRYGGFYLDKSNCLPVIQLTVNEIECLKRTNKYLMSSPEFLDKDTYFKAIGKVLTTVNTEFNASEVMVFERFPLKMSNTDLKLRYSIISEAILKKTKVEMDYISSKGIVHKHIIHPYIVYIYNNSWYVLGFNESVDSVGYFKINRIKTIHLLDELFDIDLEFEKRDYFDDYGMKQSGEYYTVVIELNNVQKFILEERNYGKNQSIKELPNGKLLFKADMQHKDAITSFVMGFGPKAIVKEPFWLKERVLALLQESLKNYN